MDDEENEEWHDIHDETNECILDGTIIPLTDNSDFPMFDSRG